MKHSAFLASHVLFVVLACAYLYDCSSIIPAGVS